MTQLDFSAVLAERTVLISCPDNDRGGVALPPDGWEEHARDQEPTLHEIEGPTISGCYALRWRDDSRTDAELLVASLGLINPAADRAAAVEAHVVADDSDDPEHVDDCPGCEDTLPAWLARRFDPQGAPWDGMSDDDRAYWEHHARAVRRAVDRDGFKTGDAAQP